jgi:tetraacyldisaccharide 4'-kinase
MAGLRHISRPALLPLSLLYGFAVLIRNLLFDLQILKSAGFNLPVISIGNITVGGTGKTPHVEFLIRLLKDDFRIAVLSRGYRRKTRNFVLATKKSKVVDIGDEPRQLKRKFPDVPVAVERHRVMGVRTLMERISKLDLVLLDDAYQHRHILPGFSILLVDYNRPVFHDMLLPAGNLREPWRNAKRADVIIVTKCPDHLSLPERLDFITRLRLTGKQEVFFTGYVYGKPVPVFPDKHGRQDPVPYKSLNKSRTGIMLVTGIANPGPLRQFLEQTLHVDDELIFDDHHEYDLKDVLYIQSRFQTIERADKRILVTEKDAVRLQELDIPDKRLRKSFYYIPVEVKFLAKGQKPFIKRIYKYLKKSGL